MLNTARVRAAMAGVASEAPRGVVAGKRHAAVAIVLAGPDAHPSVCFIERVQRSGDHWSGDIAFPGGWASDADPDLRATAVRETKEEVGLVLAPLQHLGDLTPMAIARQRRGVPGSIGASVFHVGERLPPLTPDPRETAGAFWIPARHLYDPANRTTVHWARSGPPQPRPGIAWREHVIWGLTYRLLARFTELVLDGVNPLPPDPA